MVKAGLIVAFLVAVVCLAWMAFLPAYTQHQLSKVTGFDIKVPILCANPFTGRLYVQDFSAKNPSGYPSPDFIDIHSLQSDVEVFPILFGGEVTIDNLDLNVGTLEIVRRQTEGRISATAAPRSRRRRLPGHPRGARPASSSRGSTSASSAS